MTLAQPEDIPVVEAYIMVGDGQDQVTAFLHWTLGTRPARDLLDLGVVLIREDGVEVPLFPEELSACLRSGLETEVEGVCYTMGSDAEGFFAPGTRVELEILLDEGRFLRGGTAIPDDIQFIAPAVRKQCALAPGVQLEFMWNRSPGVWAYSAETEIKELRSALAAEGIVVETDSVALLGLAVSDSDTTIVFPGEFGVFDRFDLEQEVAVALQGGLPRGAVADVVIAALDQNYVNWVRGGNFNPSGPVRVSSLRGPGVGVLGSVVRRRIVVRGGDPNYNPGALLPDCFLKPGP
ncbi:MAG: hypothetical protein ABIF09_18295 [Gemmatimonadota bacterium]